MSTNPAPTSQMTGKDIILKITPNTSKPEICAAYLLIGSKQLKAMVTETLEAIHPSRPRAKNLIGMKEDTLADFMADIMTEIPQEIIYDIYAAFIIRNRRPLLDAFYRAINIKTHTHSIGDLHHETNKALKKLSKKKMTSIWDTLCTRYPTEDVAILFAYICARDHEAAAKMQHCIETLINAESEKAETGQSPARRRFNSLRRRLYWYGETLGYEHELITKDLFMPQSYIMQEGNSLWKEFKAVIEDIHAQDPMWQDIIHITDEIEDLRELEKALDIAEKRIPILKEHQQITEKAIESLKKLTRATTEDPTQPLPILKFRRDAQKLISTISTEPAGQETITVARQINEKKHPLAAILELIENDNMEIGRYEELKEIALKYHSQEIALAAMRGKLRIGQEGEHLKRHKTHHPEIPIIHQPYISPIATNPQPQDNKQTNSQQPQTKKPGREFYDMLSKSDPQTLALQILTGTAENHTFNIKALALHALSTGNYRDAALIYEHMEKEHPSDNSFTIPSSLIKALSIAPYIREEDREAAEIYQLLASDIKIAPHMMEKQFQWNQSLSILTASAIMIPALTAPSLGVMARHTPLTIKGCPGLADLFSMIQNASVHYIAFTPENIALCMKWQKDKENHKLIVKEAATWIEASSKASIKYAPARNLWTNWLGKKGYVGTIIYPAAEDNRENARETASMAEAVGDAQMASYEITQASRKLFSQRASIDIAGPSKQVIITMTQEAASIAIKWAHSVQQLRENRPPAHIEQMTKDINDIKEHTENARTSLIALQKEATMMFTAIAAGNCLRSIDSIKDIIEGKPILPPAEPITWDTVQYKADALETVIEGMAGDTHKHNEPLMANTTSK